MQDTEMQPQTRGYDSENEKGSDDHQVRFTFFPHELSSLPFHCNAWLEGSREEFSNDCGTRVLTPTTTPTTTEIQLTTLYAWYFLRPLLGEAYVTGVLSNHDSLGVNIKQFNFVSCHPFRIQEVGGILRTPLEEIIGGLRAFFCWLSVRPLSLSLSLSLSSCTCNRCALPSLSSCRGASPRQRQL